MNLFCEFCVVSILARLVWCTYSGAAPLEAIARCTLFDNRFKDFENRISFLLDFEFIKIRIYFGLVYERILYWFHKLLDGTAGQIMDFCAPPDAKSKFVRKCAKQSRDSFVYGVTIRGGPRDN